MSAARAAARIKPVIVVKAGCSAALACGKEATKGRGMLDEDAVYDAAFARAGMLRVKDLKALFDSTATLSLMQPIHGNRLAVITNGRGIGLLAVSTLREKGGRLAELSETTLERLRAFLPCAGLQHILLDIRPDADGRRYAAALDALLGDSALDGVLVLNAPHAGIARLEIAEAVIATVEKNADPWRTCGVLACWLGDGSAQAARQRFTEAGIPNYDTPDEAVRGFMQMFRYRHSQEMLLETPPSIPEDFRPDLQAARAVLTEAFEKGRSWLDGPEALELIRSYGMPVVASCRAVDPAAAGQAACRLEGPVTVQLLRSDGRAVTEPGSVVRNLDDPVLVAETAAAMAEEFEETSPAAARRGFLVRKTVDRRGRHELFAAMIEDPVFGPLICFGQGGEVGEATGDRALALPPLNLKLARELIQSTRVIRVPGGSTAAASVDAAALALCLVKLSQLVCDLPEVAEVTIDPLLAGSDGVVAEEAFIRIRPPAGAVDRRMAVCPYPKELEEALRLPDGRTLMLRPIRPEDEPAFQQLFAGLSPEAVRFRFLHPMKVLPHREAARLTQIDYDREMALVLATGSASGAPELCGSVRITADADNREAEFAILLRDDMTGMGLGPMLMRRIIDYGRRRGILRIHGDVLDDNRSMLRICRALGFRQQRDPDDPGIIKVTLNLQPL
jgi:acetyltransferase